MQSRSQTRSQYEYAGLGLRVAATLIDTGVLFFFMVVLLIAGALAGVVNLPSTATNPFDVEAVRATVPSWLSFATYAVIFLYYSIFESLIGATPGKLAVGIRVRMDDGRQATLPAVILRNLIRIPELILWYIPSVISYQVSSSRKRLGDYAGHTMVVRQSRQPAPPERTVRAAPAAASQPRAARPAGEGAAGQPLPDLPTALGRLAAAAHAATAAHENFRRVAADELARERAAAAAGDETEPAYSAAYVTGWYSLASAVYELNQAWATTTAAAARAGLGRSAALARRPDLTPVLRRLAPYLEPRPGEDLSASYLRIVRDDAARV